MTPKLNTNIHFDDHVDIAWIEANNRELVF